MSNFYEVIQYNDGLPIKAFVHSVDELEMHWHNELEILFILKGSVKIRVGSALQTLHENDLILINKNEIHNTSKTLEDNIILALQIDLGFFSGIYPRANNIRFNSNLTCDNNSCEKQLNVIRAYISEIIWEMNKKSLGYELLIASKLNLLASYLLNNYDYVVIEEDSLIAVDEEINRLQRILTYIDKNLGKKIALQDISDLEHLNIHYLSHFFKKN